jgi:hypothetical protein
MQWHTIVGSPDPLNFTGSLWPGEAPERGNLAPGSNALIETILDAPELDAWPVGPDDSLACEADHINQ